MQSVLLALVFAGVALACDDDHTHAGHVHNHAKRKFPAAKLAPPSRPLTWGSLNIIHTTDSHGWLLGHQKTSFPEPNYSADFGDFSSFVTHMKELALKKDVDLLLVDSGDLHDGTGLSDGYPAGGVDAQQSNEFFQNLPYDVLAIGSFPFLTFLLRIYTENQAITSCISIMQISSTGFSAI
jgi:2',3'-cyclic-nucleotide 2'-phosphodiesterase (5'-nucleotidase family)